MKKPAIMILGAGLMQLPAFDAARKNGWTAIAADGNPEAPCRNRADLFLNIDLKDRIGLAEAASELKEEMDLKGVFTCGTDFSSSVAWVAEKLELPGIPYQTALDCTDKYRMRLRFKEHGVPCPGFCELSEDMDYLKAVKGLEYPLVVKPVDNMGGRGVITVESEDSLESAVKEAISFSRSSRAIAEEFMDGREYSIDSLVLPDGEIRITGFADRHIYYPPCFIEMGHTLPSELGEEDTQEVFRVFRQAVEALGIKTGSAKGDIKLTSRGVMIGEIAARLSGGFMSGWTYPYASGVSLVEQGMRVAMGLDAAGLDETLHNTSSERAYLSIPGVIKSLDGLEEAHSSDAIRDIFVLAEEGDRVYFPLNNVMKCGNVIAVAGNREDALKASAEAVSTIRITLEPGDSETGQFLSEPLGTVFPPSAYNTEEWDRLLMIDDFKPDYSMKYNRGEVIVPSSSNSAFLDQLDWNGVSLVKALEEIGFKTDIVFSEDTEWTLYSRHFWHALIRGGIQGCLWYIESNDEEA